MMERTAAVDLLSHYWSGKTLPVDPAEIAAAVGVEVIQFPPQYTATASGWFKLENNRPTIYFNPTENETRQRFTIAHELGHYILNHGERKRDGAAAFNLMNFDPVESSANKFAAELLMPEEAVRALVVGKGISSISKLASAFRVSEVAMQYRLKNLELVPA